MNYFRPSSKVIYKQKIGAKIKKYYDVPKTPFQRLLDSSDISNNAKEQLTKEFESLNPFVLQKIMETKIKYFLKNTKPVNVNYSFTSFN